jgi:site-specific DNA recombinase
MDISPNAGGAGGFSFDDSQPSPSSNRGRTRSDDFGLPGRPELLELARTYLETQARLWPDLVGTAAVPAISEAKLTAMAEGFERRFRQQAIDVFQPARLRKVWVAFGTAYVRFSDEGSNPRSLDQQLINVLGKARREDVFVPWEYVCADAAVSGTVPFRRGFAVAKALVARRAETGVAFFLIDDLSRMSRNTIDSLKLEELVSDMGARLIGASDGFDSANAQS